MQRRVVVIGGGIAGLAAAHTLVTHPNAPAVTLLEAAPRLGGKIRTERIGECVVDLGPDSFLNREPTGREFCCQLGLAERLVGVSAEARRVQLWHRGRLEELPDGLVLGVPTGIGPLARTPVLSWWGKLRAAFDLVLPRGGDPDETVSAFARRRLGREVFVNILDPLLAGVHAGDPERLALAAAWPQLAALERDHRSLILGLRARAKAARAAASAPPAAGPPVPRGMFLSLRGGMQELVDAVTTALAPATVRTGAAVEAIRAGGGGSWTVQLTGGETLDADAVIVALPAVHAAELLASTVPAAVEPLRAIPTSATAGVFAAYDASACTRPLAGTGVLVPRGTGRTTFAATFTSRKLPDRAPEGVLLLRAFVGGRRDPEQVQRPDDELIAAVREDLDVMLAIRGEPRWTRVLRWPTGTPQYEQGHAARLAAIDAALAPHAGLHLTGASYRGVGIPDCIADGQRVANAALA